jgi:hypothetical protein
MEAYAMVVPGRNKAHDPPTGLRSPELTQEPNSRDQNSVLSLIVKGKGKRLKLFVEILLFSFLHPAQGQGHAVTSRFVDLGISLAEDAEERFPRSFTSYSA